MISNLFRATSVFACQELESVGPGCAGIIGNILHAEYIAMTALLAFAFFAEKLAPVETIGASIIGGAVVGVTAVKAVKQKCRTPDVGDIDSDRGGCGGRGEDELDGGGDGEHPKTDVTVTKQLKGDSVSLQWYLLEDQRGGAYAGTGEISDSRPLLSP